MRIPLFSFKCKQAGGELNDGDGWRTKKSAETFRKGQLGGAVNISYEGFFIIIYNYKTLFSTWLDGL